MPVAIIAVKFSDKKIDYFSSIRICYMFCDLFILFLKVCNFTHSINYSVVKIQT